MSENSSDQPTVLVVDDNEGIADLYSSQLSAGHTVRTAYGGPEAIEAVDEAVDVILLDRRMPELSGDEVLDQIRAEGYDCRVIMVTAVDPDFDIIDMPFDDYLCKPVDKATLVDAIDHQLTAKQYSETLSELYQAKSKLAVLEAEKPSEELEESSEYQQLEQQAAASQIQAEQLISELDDFEAAFKSIDRHSNKNSP